MKALLAAALTLGAFTPLSTAAPQDAFDLDDLKALIGEILPHVPQNPAYRYPIEITLTESPVVNASAGYYVAPDGALQAMIRFERGMIDATGSDLRLLRAVAAHELAHLALNHALEGFGAMADLDNHWTRAEEHAADVMAVEYLELAGHPAKDVVDMLLFLDRNAKSGPQSWFHSVSSTHASPVTRAALISGDDKVLSAVARFELGLAYMECRRYREALVFFDEAIAIEPRLNEAYANAASAALQSYYESLPDDVLAQWLLPEFGVHLTDTSLLDAKGLALTDKDLLRYQDALRRIETIPAGTYPTYAAFLSGTARVLHPKGEKSALEQGVATLRGLLESNGAGRAHEMGSDRIRWANNLALGLQRLGQGTAGARALITEQAANMQYVPAAAANLARLPLTELNQAQQKTAIDVLIHHLNNTSAALEGRAQTEATVDAGLKRLSLQLNNPYRSAPVFLCRAARIVIDDKEVGLFETITQFVKQLGKAHMYVPVNEKYAQLGVYYWGVGADVVVVSERGGAMKVSSYKPGSYVELLPTDKANRDSFKVTVGMSRADLEALLAPSKTALRPNPVQLMGRAALPGVEAGMESWIYYPSLNMGVLFDGDTVAGVTVTPVK